MGPDCMGKPYSMGLRKRVRAEIAKGGSCRAAPRRDEVSPSSAVKLIDRMSRTGSVEPARQGRPPGGGKLAPNLTALLDWGRGRAGHHDARTGGQATGGEGHYGASGVAVAGASEAGLSFKKALLALEAEREDVRQARDERKVHCQPRMRDQVHRLVFLDETGTTTKMRRLRGRLSHCTRLKPGAPLGHGATQTFIAGLRSDGLVAPWVIDQPMNRQIFNTFVETQLAPTPQLGDVVILDNLPSYKSAKAEAIFKQRAAWFLFLPL